MKNLSLVLIGVIHLQNSFGQSPGTDASPVPQAAFNAIMADYTEKHHFNGTILVQQRGRKIYNESFGLANFQFGIPDTNETKYKIAYITKLFTSVLIMQLAEQGKLDLEHTIKAHLPDYKGEGAEKVTIFHLLTATSGIESNEKDASAHDIPAMYARPYNTDDLLNLFCSGKLENQPGKVWNYNNADYVILGKIIEAVCKKPYEDALKERILEPLQMANTGMFGMTKVIRNLANVYEVNDRTGAVENTPPIHTENYYAAGGLYSTADDFLKFANALYGEKLVNGSSLRSIIQPYHAGYGLGLWVHDKNVNNQKIRIAERQGAIWGTKARLVHVFDRDITIILLSNAQTTSIDDLQTAIIKALVK